MIGMSDFSDWLVSLRRKVIVILLIVSFVLMGVGYYLSVQTDRDGVTTLTGHYVSWEVHPYESIGNMIIFSGLLLLILSLIYGLKVYLNG